MRHDLILEGPAYRLRPICDDDAPFVLALRTNPALNRYLHRTAPSLVEQLAWQASYYERSGDYYFIAERRDEGTPDGVIAIYDIDRQASCGEWGRWIIRPGSLAAVESVWLIYRCAFEQLALASVYCRTVANNQPVVSFHDSCGIADRQILPGHFEFDGQLFDAVEHRVDHHCWQAIGPRLEQLAQMSARRIHRG